ncbi:MULTISPECIES: hypothetical protein [Streptomyces]|nr:MULTISPECIES: hypothetical protein [unclassified Streptomyces]
MGAEVAAQDVAQTACRDHGGEWGFYGWIGDTRIVSRALSTRDFLTPFE